MSEGGSEEGPPPSGPGAFQRLTPDVVRRSFAVKFGIVLLVMGLSVGVIGLGATEQMKSETSDNVRDEYEQVALQEAGLIEQWITRNEQSARLVSSNDVLSNQSVTASDLHNLGSNLQGEEVQGIHLVENTISATTVVTSTTLESGRNLDEGNRSWAGNTSLGSVRDVHMSSVYVANNRPVVGYVSNVPGTGNRQLLIEYKVEAIASSLRGAERATGGFTQVVASSGTVMVDEPRADSQSVGEETLRSYSEGQADGPLLAANRLRESDGEAGVETEMPGNDQVIDETYTVGYAPIEGTDWVVLVHAPYSSVFAFVSQIQTWGLLATAAGVVLIGGVGATLGYSTSTSIDRLTRKTEEMRQGNLDVEIHSTRIDNIGRLYDGFADMRDSLRAQIDEAERARKEAEVSRAQAMQVSEYLEEKAEEFSLAMEQTAAGDMTQRMQTDGENESMDRIAEEFNAMMAELEKTTGQLKSFADEVAESGDVVLASAESVREASEDVADSVQKMSGDAHDQKDRLRDVSADVDDLVSTLERFDEHHSGVDLEDSLAQFRAAAGTVRQAAEISEDLMDESEHVAGAAEEQAAELNEVSSRADKLKRYARPLGDILNRFETEAEHEFVFSGGPSQSARDPENRED